MKRRTFIKTNFTLTSGLLLFGQQACKSNNNLLQDIFAEYNRINETKIQSNNSKYYLFVCIFKFHSKLFYY